MKFNVSKITQEETPLGEYTGRRSWRWVLEIDWCGIYLYQYVKFGDEKDWENARVASYFVANFTKHFRLGSSHNYYDGPHCSFSLGFLHFCWSYWWCKKCMPD